MKDKNYKIGDIVSIRDWDDMKQEYGMIQEYGMFGDSININGRFTQQMRKLCNKNYKITKINKSEWDENFIMYRLEDIRGKRVNYTITKEMLR